MLMQPSRLRTLLIGVLLAVQLVAVVTLVWGTQRDATVALRETAERTLERFAERVDESTRTYLEGAENVVSGGDRLIGAGLLDASDDEALKRFFAVEMQTYPWISSMTLGRSDGGTVYVSRDGDELSSGVIDVGPDRRVPTSTAPGPRQESANVPRDVSDSYDPRERPWYRAARASNGPVWTAPYAFYGEAAVPGISVAVTLGRTVEAPTDGIGAGVLAVNLDLRTLSSFVSAVPGAGDGSAVLVDATGRVVAYSDAERFASASAGKGIPSLADLGDGLLERLRVRHGTRIATSDVATTDLEPLLVDGRQHLAAVRPFSTGGPSVDLAGPTHADMTDEPWMLIAQVPFDRYTDAIRKRFARRLVVLVAVLASSALAAVVAVLRLTRPVYRIHRDATIDPLTEACNRAEFERRIDARAGRARRGDGSTVLVAFDLDGFKGVNDTYGHAAGDAVLVAFVRRLKSRLRSSDIVARLGGDEFAVALDVHGAAADDAAVIEEIRADAVREAIAFAGERLVIGATAGIARRFPGESVTATLARADRALVAGKSIAKNRTYAASSAPDTDALVVALPATGRARLDDAARIAASDEHARMSA